MVQIVAPPGWKPPATAEKAPQQTVASGRQAPASPAAEGEVYTAQLADDDPLARPHARATPAEKRVRLALVGIVALVSLIIVGFGLWSSFGGSDGDDVAEGNPSASATPSSPGTPTTTGSRPTVATASGTSPAAISPATGTLSATGTAMTTGTVPAAGSASATVTAVPSPSATQPASTPSASTLPPPRGSPSTSVPMVVVLATATPTAAPLAPPTASANPTKPAAAPAGTPPAVAGPPAVEVAARLQEKIPALKFDGTPLRAALAVVAELAGVPLRYDWSTLPLDFRPDDRVVLQTEQTTLGEVFERLTKERGVRVVAVDGALEVAGPAAGAVAPQVVDHPIDDLFGTEEGAAESAGRLVRAFVAPDTWNAQGGGSLVSAPGKLVISHTPQVQEEAAVFLNRLRTAREKPPRAIGGVAAVAPPAETRVWRARAILLKPVTMNFRPGVPLPAVLAHLEEATKLPIVVDYGALTAGGYSVDEPIGISASEHPLADVLDALCRPRAWGWYLPRDTVIELTSLEAARSRTYVELYDVRSLIGEQSAESFTARMLDATPDLGWNEAGSRTAIGFDQPSGRLIVRQSTAGHLRLERLLTNPAGAAPGPAASPTGSAPARSAPSPSPTAR